MTQDVSDDARPEVSVIVPACNEAPALRGVIDEIETAMGGRLYEIIVVDDGSSDGTAPLLQQLAAERVRLKTLRHPEQQGKSAAVYTGALGASAHLLVTVDGDGQNDPGFIAEMLAHFSDPRIGLVGGQRIARKSSMAKKAASRLANAVRRFVLRDDTRDSACGLKAIRREAFLALPYFEGMHRFLPALLRADGWDIAHIDVVDRVRRHGRSHYGNLDRLAAGIPDLIGVAWLVRRRRRRPRFRGRVDE